MDTPAGSACSELSPRAKDRGQEMPILEEKLSEFVNPLEEYVCLICSASCGLHV